VLAQAKAVFAQQQWTVQGNIYQAGGDIHIHTAPSTATTPEKAKPLVGRWQAWAGLAVAVLTAVTLLLDLPVKWGRAPPSAVPLEQPLAGTVLDEGTGEPLPEVVICLPDFDMKRTSEWDGSFRFRVTSQRQASNEEPRPSRRGLLTIQAALDPSPARLGAGHRAESWPR